MGKTYKNSVELEADINLKARKNFVSIRKKTESVNSYNLRVSEEFKIDRSVKYYKIYYKCSHSLPLADRKGCENKSKKILEAFFQIVHLTYQLDIIDLENALKLIING